MNTVMFYQLKSLNESTNSCKASKQIKHNYQSFYQSIVIKIFKKAFEGLVIFLIDFSWYKTIKRTFAHNIALFVFQALLLKDVVILVRTYLKNLEMNSLVNTVTKGPITLGKMQFVLSYGKISYQSSRPSLLPLLPFFDFFSRLNGLEIRKLK